MFLLDSTLLRFPVVISVVKQYNLAVKQNELFIQEYQNSRGY